MLKIFLVIFLLGLHHFALLEAIGQAKPMDLEIFKPDTFKVISFEVGDDLTVFAQTERGLRLYRMDSMLARDLHEATQQSVTGEVEGRLGGNQDGEKVFYPLLPVELPEK